MKLVNRDLYFFGVLRRIGIILFAIQLPLPVLSQTGWQPCGAGTCVMSGNVGIGTTAPYSLLDIYAPSNSPVLYLRNNNATFRFLPSSGANYIESGSSVASDSRADLHFTSMNAATTFMTIRGSSGNVGIGTIAPQYKLAVNGTIGTREVIVTNTGWADYVLKPGYALKPLSHIEAYIRENQRLPEMPSEAEVKEKGVSLAEMQAKLLAKIEELTLHMIELDKQDKALREKLAGLEKRESMQ